MVTPLLKLDFHVKVDVQSSTANERNKTGLTLQKNSLTELNYSVTSTMIGLRKQCYRVEDGNR